MSKRWISGTCVVGASVMLLAFSLAWPAWASPENLLKSNQVPAEQILKSDAGNQKFNTLRFETFGAISPEARILGYCLYKDGIEVRTSGPQFETVGKMYLNEVITDYGRVTRERFHSRASMPIISEIIREGSVVGYTVSDLNMEVSVWDMTKDPSKISLEIRYKDLRSTKGGRSGTGPK